LDAPLERPGNIPKKISAEISKIFAQDDTSVYTFTYMQTSIGRYLDKKGVQTVGQYLKRIKEDSSFRTEQCREEGYAEFRENLFVYFARNEEWQALQAKKVLKDKPSKDIQEKKTAQPKAKKLETIEKIEDLQTFDAERFKEGSKEMEKINDIIKEYQYKMVRSFMDEGMDAAEVEQFLDDEIEKAKKLIAQKRKELERGVALGQMIKKINDTKYKRNPNMKEEGHMYNPFGTDDFGI